jgi:catechol 2,3-dioxygenase-like lactoylglutathione lyase family enzyme
MTATAAQFGLGQIGQIAINVKDLQRAVAFYRDTLGMRFLFDAPNLAFFDAGGVRLLLGVPEKAEFDHPSSILYYKVDDIESAFEALQARGVSFEDKPHIIARLPDRDVWMTFFHDSESNVVALMSEPPRAAT